MASDDEQDGAKGEKYRLKTRYYVPRIVILIISIGFLIVGIFEHNNLQMGIGLFFLVLVLLAYKYPDIFIGEDPNSPEQIRKDMGLPPKENK